MMVNQVNAIEEIVTSCFKGFYNLGGFLSTTQGSFWFLLGYLWWGLVPQIMISKSMYGKWSMYIGMWSMYITHELKRMSLDLYLVSAVDENCMKDVGD